MDTLHGEEKREKETKKKKSPFSRFLSRSSSEKKKPAKHENRKLKETQSRSLYDHSTTSNINDIPIVAGNSGTTANNGVNSNSDNNSSNSSNSSNSNSNGRRRGLAEKSESDREVVKKILKDVIKQENMDAITL